MFINTKAYKEYSKYSDCLAVRRETLNATDHITVVIVSAILGFLTLMAATGFILAKAKNAPVKQLGIIGGSIIAGGLVLGLFIYFAYARKTQQAMIADSNNGFTRLYDDMLQKESIFHARKARRFQQPQELRG